MPDFDLQSHSTHSDGALPPGEVVALAAQAGLRLLALTDHDTVGGVAEGGGAASGREHGLRVVPAAELSSIDGVYDDLHVCGYLLDFRDPALLAALESSAPTARRGRAAWRRPCARRASRSTTPARAAARGGPAVGRPHLAAAAIAHPDNAQRLRAEGRDEVGAFIEGTSSPAHRVPAAHDPDRAGRDRCDPRRGRPGGVGAPVWDLQQPEDVEGAIGAFAAMGLDGVEAFYVTHTREQTHCAVAAARAHGLLTTGSADFHGPDHRLFHRFGAFETYGLERTSAPSPSVSRRGRPPGHRPRDRPGAHRVPADLSTAHLRIVPAFAGWEDPGAAFTAVVQLGTMAAVLIYFRKDLWGIFRAWLRGLRDPVARRTLDSRLGWYLILGTIRSGCSASPSRTRSRTSSARSS